MIYTHGGTFGMKKPKANSEVSVKIQLKEERRRKCAKEQKNGSMEVNAEFQTISSQGHV
ncbi:hypothetical protein RchiOBHm_Chr1g0326091 [Rosa chinensis]|uniref:Uncharacterized protein n=1 Tax=Rosa chinensis TaxID=74649 RepID=A0A2P6SA86_ROSCH|nr:hypothetical protein RchiOBHm_Chr1g0326091 [Rosa chinensis]